MTAAARILEFYFSLPRTFDPPNDVEILYPFDDPETERVMRLFYEKYYDDSNNRVILWGINPGRKGAGITGIGFTDPILLEEKCGIVNDLPKERELSATFICDVVEAYGGPERFYGDFLFSTVLPFGLLKAGRNYNYYDDVKTLHYFEDFIVDSIRKQMAFGFISRRVATIGRGKNYDFLKKLDKRYDFFDEIAVLPHPRWVMQYRRKEIARYIEEYLKILNDLNQ